MSMQADRTVEDIYPLAPLQKGLLFHSLQSPGEGTYVVQLRCTLGGELDRDAFERAWRAVVKRHPALRTSFTWRGVREPVQVVHREVPVVMERHDWSGDAPEAYRARLERALEEDRRRGFATEKPPLMRLALFRRPDGDHDFAWSTHHALTDGWCLPLIVREVFALYAAFSAGRERTLPPAPRYRDYIAWLRRQDAAAAERFWRDELRGVAEPTLLSASLGTDPGAGEAGHGEHRFVLPADGSAALREAARRHRVTLNTLVQGAWALLLGRCCGADEVVFGATVAGRPAELEGAEEMIGLFINTLPARVRLPSDAPLGEWLRAQQARTAETRQFEYAPLGDVLRWSGVPGGTPLFDTLLVFENFPLGEALRDAGGAPEVRDVRTVERGSHPLALVVVPSERLSFRLVFERDRFAADTVERLGRWLRVVLAALARDPAPRLGGVDLLEPAERRRVLAASRGPGLPAAPLPVHLLFERQALAHPDRVAVRQGDEPLTYGELDRRSARLALALRGMGVGPEVRVGVCAELSPDAMVGILAVLRAGGAYVPLDPAHPPERLAGMLADAAAPVLLTRERLLPHLPAHGARVVLLDAGAAPDGDVPPAPPAGGVDPDGLAYVIFTSGSTGAPKGVEVGHHSLACSTAARFARYPEPVGGLLLLSSVAVDTSVAGIFWTLCSGGTLHVPPPEARLDPARLVELAARGGATHLVCVPSLYAALLDEAGRRGDWAPASVVVAGEVCPPELVELHARVLPGTTLRNEYGPTEGTVWCTVHECGADAPAARIPIGRPVPGAAVYVLDPEGAPAPDGVPGELHVGGRVVARGYLGRPRATAAAFVPDPWAGEPGARMYRTGDRARRRPDGALEFLGRTDAQVKVRGHRVEPGEVEAALLAHPAVGQAAVAARPDPRGEPRLVAWVAGAGGTAPSAAELRTHLHARLPAFMIPTALVALDALPRTPGGKIDRQALPDPEWGRGSGGHRPPGTPVEEVVAGIWGEVLGVEGVGADDDFFALGGHSLLAMRLASQLRELLRVEVPVAELFAAPVLAAQAERACEIGRAAGVDVERVAGLLLRLRGLPDEQVAAMLSGGSPEPA